MWVREPHAWGTRGSQLDPSLWKGSPGRRLSQSSVCGCPRSVPGASQQRLPVSLCWGFGWGTSVSGSSGHCAPTAPSSVGTFARALDCSSSVRQPSLHMSAAAASRDITLVSGPGAGICTQVLLGPCWGLLCPGHVSPWGLHASQGRLGEPSMPSRRAQQLVLGVSPSEAPVLPGLQLPLGLSSLLSGGGPG